MAAYESQGGGILDTLTDMKTKGESTLSDARTAEKSGLEEVKASAEEELASTKTTLAADEKYSEELKQSCSMKAAEWATRQKDAAGELAAIAKAKEVLESGVKVFLQVSNKAKAHDADSDQSGDSKR